MNTQELEWFRANKLRVAFDQANVIDVNGFQAVITFSVNSEINARKRYSGYIQLRTLDNTVILYHSKPYSSLDDVYSYLKFRAMRTTNDKKMRQYLVRS